MASEEKEEIAVFSLTTQPLSWALLCLCRTCPASHRSWGTTRSLLGLQCGDESRAFKDVPFPRKPFRGDRSPEEDSDE